MKGEKRQVYMKFREEEGSIRLEWRFEYRPDNEGLMNIVTIKFIIK